MELLQCGQSRSDIAFNEMLVYARRISVFAGIIDVQAKRNAATG